MDTPDPIPSFPPSQSPDPACTGVRWCLSLLDGLIVGGVERLVISPGSRSTPLLIAAQRRPQVRLEPVLDERSAAFYALGVALATGRPVALLATSGSAPGHWLPATMEASQSGIPLVLISADRPPELRGWGANQTLDQTRLFGPFVREFHDPGPPSDSPQALKAMTALGLRAASVSRGSRPGPVHINLPLREPLVPRRDCNPETGADPAGAGYPPNGWDSSTAPSFAPLPPPGLPDHLRGRGLICCGPGSDRPGLADALWRCAAALKVPVLVDPLSGFRFGPAPSHILRVARYDSILRNPQAARALRADWVLRFGRAPVSRTLLDWLAGTRTVLVDPEDQWPDPNHDLAERGSLHLAADPVRLCDALAQQPTATRDPAWPALWSRAERRVARLAADFLKEAPWFEAHPIVDLIATLPPADGVFCANSLPIRQIDVWSGIRTEPLRLLGNRGVSGIDGHASTLAGINAGGLPTTGLLGDLSLIHDLSGLLLAGRLRRPAIVVNNGGGRIFDYLPQSSLPDFSRLWRMDGLAEPAELARSFGLRHVRASDSGEWRVALEEGLAPESLGARPAMIEIMIDGPTSQKLHLDFRRLVAEQDLVG